MEKGFLLTFILLISLLNIPLYAAKEIAYTQDDRDRLIRMEEAIKGVNYRIDSIEKRIDSLEKRIDSLDNRINDLQRLMYVIISAIFAQIIGVVGFVLWDRRTALAPAISKNKELDEKTEKLEKAFKEIAKTDKKTLDALRKVGIL